MTKHVSTGDIINALENAGGDITAAAALLGLRREAIYYRAKKEPIIMQIIEEQRNTREALNNPADPEQNTNQPTAPATARNQGAAVIAKNATTEAPSGNTPADRETIDTAINRTKAAEEYRRNLNELEAIERDINTAEDEALPAGYETAEDLINHYRQLTKDARCELIPIAEGLKQEPEPTPDAEQVSTSADRETATDPTKPTAGKLPSIADQINRQAARDLAATIRQYIQYNGLPKAYGQVIDYLKYLDGKAAGRT